MNGVQLSRYGAMARSLPTTMGKVFFVVNAADTNGIVSDMMADYPVDKDGVPRVYTSIQSALDACVSGRDDYVLVLPSSTDYTPAATLTMSKNNVHLLCPSGMNGEIGANPRAATIGQATSAGHTITISGRACEVAGFWIRTGTEKYGIYFSSSAATGSWIHHNEVAIYSTTSSGTLAGGIYDGGGVAGVLIERNHIFTNSGTSATIVAGIYVPNTATRAIVRKNLIDCSNTCTMTSGIYNYAVMGVVADNDLIAHHASGSGEGTGVFTKGIRLGVGTTAMGNRVAMATLADSITGGYIEEGGVLNFNSGEGGTQVDIADGV